MNKISLVICIIMILIFASGDILAKGQGQGAAKGQSESSSKKQGDATQQMDDANRAQHSQQRWVRIGNEKGSKGHKMSDANQVTADQKPEKSKKEMEDVNDGPREPNQLSRGQKMQMLVIENQLVSEQAKHLERQAKLERIQKLAKDKGNEELANKAAELIQQEQQRYEKMTKRLNNRKQRIMKSGPPEVTVKTKDQMRDYLRKMDKERMKEMENEPNKVNLNKAGDDN